MQHFLLPAAGNVLLAVIVNLTTAVDWPRAQVAEQHLPHDQCKTATGMVWCVQCGQKTRQCWWCLGQLGSQL